MSSLDDLPVAPTPPGDHTGCPTPIAAGSDARPERVGPADLDTTRIEARS